MRKVFVDTAAWLALVNKTDGLHSQAKEIRNELTQKKCSIVTSNLVLVETVNALSREAFRQTAIQFMQVLQNSKGIEIVEVDKGLFKQGWELFAARTDKDWSLTDCISFVIMKRQKIKNAFTSDHHFVQAGFEVLITP